MAIEIPALLSETASWRSCSQSGVSAPPVTSSAISRTKIAPIVAARYTRPKTEAAKAIHLICSLLAPRTPVAHNQAQSRGEEAQEEQQASGFQRIRHPRMSLEPERVAYPSEIAQRAGREEDREAEQDCHRPRKPGKRAPPP